MASTQQPQIGQSIARGASIMVGVSLFGKILATVSQFILAGLLFDTEYGLVAVTFATIDMFGIVQKMGLREMLLHRQDRIQEWINPVIWLSAAGGLLTFLLLVAFSPVAPWVFDASPEMTRLVIVAAVGAAMVGMIGSLEATLSIGLRFKTVGALQTCEVLTRTLLQIALAYSGFGAMSIILPRSMTWVLHAVALLCVVRPKLKRSPEIAKIRTVVGDCANLFVTNASFVAIRQGDYFLLGVFASEAVVGAYYFAFALSTQAIMLVAQGMSSVLAAGLSKLKAEPERQLQAFLNAIGMISFVAVPLLAMQAASADPLLRGLYGDKWITAIVPLQILSLAACWSAAGWNCGAMYAATGRFRAQRITALVGGVSFLITISFAAWLGNEVTVALAVLAFRSVYVPIQVGVAAGGRMRVAMIAVFHMLRPMLLCVVAGVPAVYLGRMVQRDLEPKLIKLAERLGENDLVVELVGIDGMRGSLLAQVFVTSVVIAALYYVLSRILLRRTYTEFAARIRTILPAKIASLLPRWLL